MSDDKKTQTTETANRTSTVQNPDYKLIANYQQLIARANKVGIQLSIDGAGFILTQAAGKWEPMRKQSMDEIETFLEGTERAAIAQPRDMAQTQRTEI